jgi:enoyl-CoA hydratase
MTARMNPAADALRIGLVTEVVEPGTHVEAATRLAQEIAANAPLAVGLAKRILDLGQHLDTQTFLQVELLAQSILLPTADAREGAAALAERRTPKFTGR